MKITEEQIKNLKTNKELCTNGEYKDIIDIDFKDEESLVQTMELLVAYFRSGIFEGKFYKILNPNDYISEESVQPFCGNMNILAYVGLRNSDEMVFDEKDIHIDLSDKEIK